MTKRQRLGLLGFMSAALVLGVAVLMLRGGIAKRAVATPACASSTCPPLRCQPGFHAEIVAKACCPSCTPDPQRLAAPDRCAGEPCATCPSGSRAETVEGQCCPSCVHANEDACAQGRARYEARRSVLEGELRACTADDDCMVASFDDACRASCPLPLNKRRLGTVIANLREEASLYCELCAPERFDCPNLDPSGSRCVRGRCEFAPTPEHGPSSPERARPGI